MLFLASACATASPVPVPPPAAPTAQQQADTMAAGHEEHHHGHAGLPDDVQVPAGAAYTVADVHFMQGMVAHHAQAIVMSRLADTRSTDTRLVRLARKIDQSQESEITLMQGWLHDRGQWVPDTASWRTITMAGMLTREELDGLARAGGAAFDRSFLELMIRHHEGALAMVTDLFATPRAGQEVDVNVFANEVRLVQEIEIGLMRAMLDDLNGAP